jgi:hypothetical protein
MGMDIYGKNPSAEVGGYFRQSVYGWHPLWDYACSALDLSLDDPLREGGHYNDGHALDAQTAERLAARLTDLLSSGKTALYEADYNEIMDGVPNETCNLCFGTGKRPGWDDLAWCGGCNGCHGEGTRRPHETWYRFDVETVRAFRDFVAASGGFEIH